MRLARLVGTPAVTEGGARIGRVCDVWAESTDEGLVLTALVINRGAVLALLGLRRGTAPPTAGYGMQVIRWRDVVRIDDDRVVVRAS